MPLTCSLKKKSSHSEHYDSILFQYNEKYYDIYFECLRKSINNYIKFL
jgi:hypothetical protein